MTDADRERWAWAVAHVRGLADGVLAEFDAQAARFVCRAAEGDIRRREIQAARREIEPDARAVIAKYLPEVDINDRIVRIAYRENKPATAAQVWGELYILVHLVETGCGNYLNEFELPVANAMIWWLHPLPDPMEGHWPQGLPAPRPRPQPAALPAPDQDAPQSEPTPRLQPVATYEPIVSIGQPPPAPRWGPGVLRIEGTIYIREAPGGVLIGTRDGEYSRPDLLRRLTDVRDWFPAARWRDGDEGPDHQGWFVPGTTALRRVNAWLDAGGRDAPRPDRPPRRPRPTRAGALAASRARRVRQREEAMARAEARWAAERAEVEAAAAERRRVSGQPPATSPEPFGLVTGVTDMSPLWLGQIHTPAHLVAAVGEAAAVLSRRQEAGLASRYQDAGYVLIQHVPEGVWSATGYHVVPERHANGFPDLRTLEGVRMGEGVTLERAAQILEWARWHHGYVIRYAQAFCDLGEAAAGAISRPGEAIVANTAQIMQELE